MWPTPEVHADSRTSGNDGSPGEQLGGNHAEHPDASFQADRSGMTSEESVHLMFQSSATSLQLSRERIRSMSETSGWNMPDATDPQAPRSAIGAALGSLHQANAKPLGDYERLIDNTVACLGFRIMARQRRYLAAVAAAQSRGASRTFPISNAGDSAHSISSLSPQILRAPDD